MRLNEDIKPTILVVFGISGDLSRRYCLPALVAIEQAGLLPSNFKLVGISRRELKAKDILGDKSQALSKYFQGLQMDMQDIASYQVLKKRLAKLAKKSSSQPQIIFYLVVPPEAVAPIVHRLGEAELNTNNAKLLLEKPFGSDLKSAIKLIKETKSHFRESQLYYIDHYLAKEMVQNLNVFLDSNALFSRDVWSSQFIEEIEIVAAEKIGVEARGVFYEQTGALRDLVQSHLLQLAALTLMEPTTDVFDMEQLPPRRLAALKQIKPLAASRLKDVMVGQYEEYAKTVGNPDTTNETFVALSLHSKDPRWKNMPIKLATGKSLNDKLTEIRVRFKKSHASQANLLVLRIQPKEGIELDLWVKEPGYHRKLQKLSLRFAYDQHFEHLPDAYEQVLVDAMRGSHGLFATSAEVIASWMIIQPILDHWAKDGKDLKIYKSGSTLEEAWGK